MTKRTCVFGLVVSVLVMLGPATPRAADDTDCTGSPPQAVMTLPKPLDKWGEVACTIFGHVLTSKKGWLWMLPALRQPVMLPSQMVDRMPKPLGNTSYFTSIEVVRVNGDEFEAAYQTFHQGLDPHETLPEGYRVDLLSVSGKTMRLYFFDYNTYAWGMECPGTICNRNSRFVILDQAHMPKPLGSSI